MFSHKQRAILMGLGFQPRHNKRPSAYLSHVWENLDYLDTDGNCLIRVGSRGVRNDNDTPDYEEFKFWAGNPTRGALARTNSFSELIAAIATIRLVSTPINPV